MDDTYLFETIEKQESLGLLYGKLGIAICSLYNSDSFSSGKFNKRYGEKVLEQMYEKIGDYEKLGIVEGLNGIGIGLDYLVKHSYIEGNIDDILGDIDNFLFKKVVFADEENKIGVPELIEILIYLSFRFENGLNKEKDRCIFEELAMKTINVAYINWKDEMGNEPVPFTLYNGLSLFLIALARIHKLGIYRNRIEKILEEMQLLAFSRIPVLHANRLVLLYAVSLVYNTTRKKEWKEYAVFIKSQLSLEKILFDEMKNRNVFFIDGIAGIYILLHFYNKTTDDEKIEIDHSLFYNRIISSYIWEDFETDQELLVMRGGLGGYLGLKLLLTYIQSKIV